MNSRKDYLFAGIIAFLLLFMPLAAGRTPVVQGALPEEIPSITESSSEASTAPPTAPPKANKITVSSPDADGYATVTGIAGAVPGNAGVAIINLNTRNVITENADSSGAFNAALFAPPGSFLLIKYSLNTDLIELLWQHALDPGGDFSYMNPLPGTTIFVPGPSPGGSGKPFHSAGFFGPGEGPDWAGWWISGTAAGPGGTSNLHLQPGAQVTITGQFNVTSPGMGCSNPPSFTPQLDFQMRDLFGAQGTPRLGGPWFNAFIFTPTGLPIEHEADPEVRVVDTAAVTSLTCLNSDTAQGNFETTFTVPGGLTNGVYGLGAYVHDNGVPLASGVRRVVVWYHFDPLASLPVITIGEPAPPRIPWTLFADSLTNGHRGVQAQEDIGNYQMLTRTVLPPHKVVLPMVDERSGTPIAYPIEPGSNWLSSTDRRFPIPPQIPLKLPGGSLQAEIFKPDGGHDVVGPVPIKQSSVRTPSLPDGSILAEGTGHVGDIYHLHTRHPDFAYTFDQYGEHTIILSGYVEDIYGNEYPIHATYEVMIARILDVDPAQLPTTPYEEGDYFAPGLHLFPPVPADVEVRLVHMPNSDPAQAQVRTFTGQANKYGYFQPPAGTKKRLTSPGEFRVDISAEYIAPDGTHWAGYVTWGNVVEGDNPQIKAHGRRGMDYQSPPLNMSAWFTNEGLAPEKMGIENYYPYHSGDIHWGEELAPTSRRGDSIHSIITLEDLSSLKTNYDLIRDHFPRASNRYRQPPEEYTLDGLNLRLAIDEAPLFITTTSGRDPTVYPDEVDMWGYTYASSERPDVHVREIIGEDGMGTAYWRFNDTYGYQIGEPADGDQPGDLKWEFGGVVFRVPGNEPPINEYAIYSSLWVLLPPGCDDEANIYGCARVTPPFQDATGASINGGPIMTLLGEEIDMLFLPKGIRPGDVLEVGDTVAFSGHVGPPLDSKVEVTITSPTGAKRSRTWHANKIGWLYDPTFDFAAQEAGRWTVDVSIEHDRPLAYAAAPTNHNTGTVLGTSGQYEFYVVEPHSAPLTILSPQPGFIPLPSGTIDPILMRGVAPAGSTSVHYTIHDKGIVMGRGTLTPDSNGVFTFSYDPVALHENFSMLSLMAHEGRRLGLADEVSINFLAVGSQPSANTVTLIGEEVFINNLPDGSYLPLVIRR
jgi:hypothetical protein